MADVHTAAQRHFNMSRIRGENTKPEMLLRSALHRAGVRFRIHRKDLPGKPDIVLPARRIAAFVHGCFWHRHEGCRYATIPATNTAFWKAKFERNVERDAENMAALESNGWRVVTVWECELRRSPDSVVERILLSGQAEYGNRDSPC